MCGIVGIVGAHGDDVSSAADIHSMCQSIVHRGPDDEGIYVNGRVGLGMRRLSIIDLSAGHQPIHNENRTVWVVFNGEIYNFPQLRRELESRGHHFYTNTDTEVIVHLYEQYGLQSVNRLRGMFAFAIWDEVRQRLVLARDRFGKKPLHYAFSKGRLLFGSEIKSLLAVAPELAEVDLRGLLNFFYFGYIQDPLTAFASIQKLPPGYLMEFADGRLQLSQYWDLPPVGSVDPTSEGECLERLEELVSDAVRIRLISDVPLGALLSGGVDSSTVVAMMARFSSRPVKTFAIGFRHADFNEASHARVVAKHFGTEHHELFVHADIEDTVNQLTRSLEEPFGDSSIVPTYHVCRMARQHVTVALAGDGGDELFAGYDRYISHLRREWLRPFPFQTGRWYQSHVHPLVPSGWLGRRFLFNLSLSSRMRYLDSVSLCPASVRERPLFTKDFLDWADKAESPYHQYLNYLEARPASDPLSEAQYLDIKTYLSGDILTKVDRMSMANSLEVRAPLLDHCLAEWVAGLSPKWKRHLRQSKYILKKLAEQIGVPREVLYRPKQGFSMPLKHWFRQDTHPPFLEMLLEPKTMQRGYFNRAELERRIREHRKGIRDRSWELWHLIIFELWHRNFLEPIAQLRSSTASSRQATLEGIVTAFPANKTATAEVA